MFVGRTREFETLQDEYDKNESSFVVIYGRRRVGKTTLIKEFIKDKKTFIFLQVKRLKRKTKRNCNKGLVNF